jgi:hypothetical protein
MSSSLPSGRTCRVCADPRLDQIEAELVRPGTNKRAVARSYGLGRMSILRHFELHLPDRMRRAAEVAKKAPASNRTLEELGELKKLARGVFARGYNDNNLAAAVSALRESRKIIELEGRLLGTIQEPGAQVNIDLAVDRDTLARMAGAFLTVQNRLSAPPLPIASAAGVEVLSPSAGTEEGA